MCRLATASRLEIRPGWHEEGKRGSRTGPDIKLGEQGQWWTPIVWDVTDEMEGDQDEDRLDWHKSCALRPIRDTSKGDQHEKSH